MTPLETELCTFFEHYARTFHEDVDRFCDLYHYPSSTVRLDGAVQWLHTKVDAGRFFAAAKQKVRGRGLRAMAIRSLAAERPGSGSAVATIDWGMTDAGGCLSIAAKGYAAEGRRLAGARPDVTISH